MGGVGDRDDNDSRFHPYSTSWHHFVLVPVYSHGSTCPHQDLHQDQQDIRQDHSNSSSLAVNVSPIPRVTPTQVNFAVEGVTDKAVGQLSCADML